MENKKFCLLKFWKKFKVGEIEGKQSPICNSRTLHALTLHHFLPTKSHSPLTLSTIEETPFFGIVASKCPRRAMQIIEVVERVQPRASSILSVSLFGQYSPTWHPWPPYPSCFDESFTMPLLQSCILAQARNFFSMKIPSCCMFLSVFSQSCWFLLNGF